jgi:hypothetical protein
MFLQQSEPLPDSGKSFLLPRRGLSWRKSFDPAPEMNVSQGRHFEMVNGESTSWVYCSRRSNHSVIVPPVDVRLLWPLYKLHLLDLSRSHQLRCDWFQSSAFVEQQDSISRHSTLEYFSCKAVHQLVPFLWSFLHTTSKHCLDESPHSDQLADCHSPSATNSPLGPNAFAPLTISTPIRVILCHEVFPPLRREPSSSKTKDRMRLLPIKTFWRLRNPSAAGNASKLDLSASALFSKDP